MNPRLLSSKSNETARHAALPARARARPRLRAISIDPEQSAILDLQCVAGNAAVSQALAGHRVVQRRKGAAAADPRAPERTSVDVTGFYEVVEGGSGNRITLQLNQAGHHIEGWWEQHKAHGYGTEETMVTHRIIGDLGSDQEGWVGFSYRRMDSSWGVASEGVVKAWMEGDDISLQLIEGSWQKSFKRTSEAPRISEEAISAMSGEARSLVKATQEVPLDRTEKAMIHDAAKKLYQTVLQYYGEKLGVSRMEIASAVNKVVREEMGIFTAEQRPAAIRELRYYLTRVDVKSGSVTRPVWDWLEVIAAIDPHLTPALQEYLGFKFTGISSPDAPQHKYQWTMRVLGVGVGAIGEVSAYLGQLTITKLSPDSWATDYFTVLGGAGVGAQVGLKVKLPHNLTLVPKGQESTPNEFESPFPWTSGNFAGGYTIGQVSGQFGFVEGKSYSKGSIIFSGDGTYPPLEAPADAWSYEIVLGAGVGVGISGGWLWGGKEEAVRYAREQQAMEAKSAPQSVAHTHFAVDDPSLNAIGRQKVRVMAALHRAEFENPDSTVSVDGYASPTGTHARNQLLSTLRAKNVLQAIRDSLGPAFQIPHNNANARGHGEGPALAAGVPKGVESIEWRRVDITLNGRVVLRLD